jgi:phosphoribosylanthranilate isomerase
MWLKICGIREVNSAVEIARCGVDAVGLNFYDRSPRCVSPETAAEIVAQLPAEVEPVGVFVNYSLAEIVALQRQCGFRGVQLHGDESVEYLAELQQRLPDCGVYRALRVGADAANVIGRFLKDCQRIGVTPGRLLLDSRLEGRYGGTGQAVDWAQLAEQYRRDEWPRIILAGGLTPGNVAAAIRTVRPWGVDVAGGVESAPGVKEVELVRQFVAAARGNPA